MAVASSNFTCVVGWPRRSVSSSMQGRSSCTSEYAWINSTAAAARSSDASMASTLPLTGHACPAA